MSELDFNCGKFHVGDKGQRFEVSFFDPKTNTRKVFGWSNDLVGAHHMLQAIEVHPTWTEGKILDRENPEGNRNVP